MLWAIFAVGFAGGWLTLGFIAAERQTRRGLVAYESQVRLHDHLLDLRRRGVI